MGRCRSLEELASSESSGGLPIFTGMKRRAILGNRASGIADSRKLRGKKRGRRGVDAPAHMVYYLADDTYAMLLGLLLGLFGVVRLFLYNRLFLYDCLGLLL